MSTVADLETAEDSVHARLEQARILSLVVAHTDTAVLVLDREGRIEWVNEAFCRITGYTEAEVIGSTRRELLSVPFARSPAFQAFEKGMLAGEPSEQQFPANSQHGRSYWVLAQSQPVLEDGVLVRSVVTEREVTEQRARVEQLRAANRQAQLLAGELGAEKALLGEVLSAIPHVVYWKDRDGRYAGMNPAFLTLRGLTQDAVLEHTETDLAVQDELTSVLPELEAAVLATATASSERQVVVTAADGRARNLMLSILPHLDDEGECTGVIAVAADVSRVSVLERQLAQSNRLEAIGQLAAGIAHEINTPVQYICDNTRFINDAFDEVLTTVRAVHDALAQEDGTDASQTLLSVRERLAGLDLDFLADEIPSALRQSLEGLDRVTQIVRAMKDFSHPGTGRVEAEVNRMVESTAQVSRNEWRYVAQLELDLDPQVGMVPCYEGELKQVLLNMVVNAAQALQEQQVATGVERIGTIRLSTRRTDTGVSISVSDDGPGMSADVQRKIFDPFFTTKAVGKGTGQGLSHAYQVVVTKHQGRLDVESAPGQGATFTVHLPDQRA